MSQEKQKKAEADKQTSSTQGRGEGFRLTTGCPTAFRPGWLAKKDVTRIMSKLLMAPMISKKCVFVAFLIKCFLKSSKDVLVPKRWVLRLRTVSLMSAVSRAPVNCSLARAPGPRILSHCQPPERHGVSF